VSRALPVGGLDAAFLSCETPGMHMHVCGLVVLEPATTAEATFCGIRTLLLDALARVPQLHQRLAPVLPGAGRPWWVDDAAFDMDRHLQRVSVSPPGDDAALARLVGEFVGRPLRRDRPLWEAWFVDGLSGDRVALVAKMHHAIVDGVTGVAVMGRLFGFGAPQGAVPGAEGPWRPQPSPGALRLIGMGVVGRLRAPLEMARLVPVTAGRLGATAWDLGTRGVHGGARALPFTAPRTSLNAVLTARRSVGYVAVPLDDVKAVKSAFGVKVNDVVAAVVGGALRRYLEARGELPERPLVAAEPMAVHAQVGGVAGVSKLSVMFSTLGTDVADPAERLRTVAASNARAKEVTRAMGSDTFVRWAEQIWPRSLAMGARLYARLHMAEHHPVMFNVLVSNVAGPPIDLYLAGNRVVATYAFGPIIDGAGLNVTVLSTGDQVGFGLMACPDVVPDVGALAASLPGALDELVRAARPPRGGVRRPVADGRPREPVWVR